MQLDTKIVLMFLKFRVKQLAIQSAAVTQLLHNFKVVTCSNKFVQASFSYQSNVARLL